VFAARGGCLAFHKSSLNPEGALARFFEPGVHFIEYQEDTFYEVMRDYLSNRQKRLNMAAEASNALESHTWDNRANQLLKLLN
jgi:hypothetical protein